MSSKAGSWDTATVAQYDTYRYDNAIEGDVRNGRINPKFVYVFDGSEWRRGTRLDSLLYKNGGLACAGKKNTTDGKIAVAGDTSDVKLKDLYYVCTENTADLADTAFRWVEAPAWYNDMYEARKNSNSNTDGDLLKGRVNSANVYVCDFADTDKDSLAGWEIATDLEASIGGCHTRLQDSVAAFQGKSYYCYYGRWVAGSATEDDIYSWNDTVDGAWRRGFLHPEKYYVFDESEGWRAATTNLDHTLGIDGCTQKRDREIIKVIDEENEKFTNYVCYEKKWNEGAGSSMPKDLYLNPVIKYDSITDARDGQTYKTVKIGTHVWMAQNLSYVDEVATPSLVGKFYCNRFGSGCRDSDGALYTWAAAIDSVAIYKATGEKCGYLKTCSLPEKVRGICPEGWHLPTKAEWDDLFELAGGQDVAASKLKNAVSWGKSDYGTDDFGFSAVAAGNIDYGTHYHMFSGQYAQIWSSEGANDEVFGYATNFYLNRKDVVFGKERKDYSFSVRCVKD